MLPLTVHAESLLFPANKAAQPTGSSTCARYVPADGAVRDAVGLRAARARRRSQTARQTAGEVALRGRRRRGHARAIDPADSRRARHRWSSSATGSPRSSSSCSPGAGTIAARGPVCGKPLAGVQVSGSSTTKTIRSASTRSARSSCSAARCSPAYLGDQDSASVIRCPDGWFTTSDRFMIDREGFYHHCGRVDDLFQVGGKCGLARRGRARVMLRHDAAVGSRGDRRVGGRRADRCAARIRRDERRRRSRSQARGRATRVRQGDARAGMGIRAGSSSSTWPPGGPRRQAAAREAGGRRGGAGSPRPVSTSRSSMHWQGPRIGSAPIAMACWLGRSAALIGEDAGAARRRSRRCRPTNPAPSPCRGIQRVRVPVVAGLRGVHATWIGKLRLAELPERAQESCSPAARRRSGWLCSRTSRHSAGRPAGR